MAGDVVACMIAYVIPTYSYTCRHLYIYIYISINNIYILFYLYIQESSILQEMWWDAIQSLRHYV